jgi:4-amino-4-deoxy-L-arabinose transferase-like glycosyltransferase
MLPAARNAPPAAVTAWRIAVALALAAIATWLATAALRLRYPFELEWMEGATLEHVRRVLAGQPLYAAPSLDFVAFTYPPLYYFASANVARVAGPGFLALRLVSIAASAGSLWCIYLLVRPHADRRAAVAAAGLFAATYALGGAWLDLGRVDALYLCLALATGLVVARASSPLEFAAAGLLAGLALLTKQTIAVTLVLVAPYLLLRHPRGFLCLAAAAALAVGVEVYLDARSGGWFRYYVYTLPRMRMAISARRARMWTFVWGDMLRPLAPILAATVFAWWGSLGPASARADGDRRLRIALFAAGLILSSALARLEGGAWSNALLPAYAAIAILFGVAAGRPRRLAAIEPLAIILQLALLAYDPRALVPTARDAAAGYAIVERLRELPDGVLVLDHGYLSTMAGRRSFAHGWAMTDVLWADHGGAGGRLETAVREAIAWHRFPALVLDDAPHWFARDFDASYARQEALPDPAAFNPVSGSRRRPSTIYRPR